MKIFNLENFFFIFLMFIGLSSLVGLILLLLGFF